MAYDNEHMVMVTQGGVGSPGSDTAADAHASPFMSPLPPPLPSSPLSLPCLSPDTRLSEGTCEGGGGGVLGWEEESWEEGGGVGEGVEMGETRLIEWNQEEAAAEAVDNDSPPPSLPLVPAPAQLSHPMHPPSHSHLHPASLAPPPSLSPSPPQPRAPSLPPRASLPPLPPSFPWHPAMLPWHHQAMPPSQRPSNNPSVTPNHPSWNPTFRPPTNMTPADFQKLMQRQTAPPPGWGQIPPAPGSGHIPPPPGWGQGWGWWVGGGRGKAGEEGEEGREGVSAGRKRQKRVSFWDGGTARGVGGMWGEGGGPAADAGMGSGGRRMDGWVGGRVLKGEEEVDKDPCLLRSRLTVEWLVRIAEMRRHCMASAPLHSLRELQEGVEEEGERGSSGPGRGGRLEDEEEEEEDEEENEDDWEDIQGRRDGGRRRGGRGSGRGVEGRGRRGSRGGRGGSRATQGRGGSSRGRGRGGGRGGAKRPLEALARANQPNLIFAKIPGAFAFTPGPSRVLQAQQEVVLRVEVLQQEKRQLKGQEFLVLGSQPLTALRDRIYCLQDRIAREHGKSVPSGCFCIEDVFYDDMRQPGAVRYSAVIVKWNREKRAAWSMLDERERRRNTPLARLPLPAPVRGMAMGGVGSMGTSHTFQEDGAHFGQQQQQHEQPRQEQQQHQQYHQQHQQYHQQHHHQQQQRVRLSLGDAPPPEYSAARMETTRFRDLTVRPGALYVYMHQGACKHAFRITDIRLLHALDPLNASEYPLLSHEPRCFLRRCSVCDVNASTRVVYHDKLLAVDPSFLCEQCYHLLHYDEEGNLLYSDFQVYNYYHE
ncbi:unnamed protein product [Closterium sp. NIES-53]